MKAENNGWLKLAGRGPNDPPRRISKRAIVALRAKARREAQSPRLNETHKLFER